MRKLRLPTETRKGYTTQEYDGYWVIMKCGCRMGPYNHLDEAKIELQHHYRGEKRCGMTSPTLRDLLQWRG